MNENSSKLPIFAHSKWNTVLMPVPIVCEFLGSGKCIHYCQFGTVCRFSKKNQFSRVFGSISLMNSIFLFVHNPEFGNWISILNWNNLRNTNMVLCYQNHFVSCFSVHRWSIHVQLNISKWKCDEFNFFFFPFIRKVQIHSVEATTIQWILNEMEKERHTSRFLHRGVYFFSFFQFSAKRIFW